MAFNTDTYVIRGMRQDDSDLLFNGNKEGLSFAFENMNIRFSVDKETTSLVATQERGNTVCNIKLSPSFFLDYRDFIGSYYSVSTMPLRIIGTCVVDKYLVLFGKCIRTYSFMNHDGVYLTFNEGEDVIIRLELVENTFYGWIVYKGTELGFDPNHPLECIGNVETNIVKKVYFVDGLHNPRAVNVVNKDASELSNINLGFNLQLKDELIVEKNHEIAGNFPVGKVRFFYTYYNDEFSESNIVDWSPFFDCNLNNQGGSPDSQQLTDFSFEITVKNVDTQFKFIRVYMQHFTSNDATTYKLKYIERPLAGLIDFSTVIRFDQVDLKDSSITYLDMKLTNYSFIPNTMAEKNNRMFYGNIKRSLPRVNDLDLTNIGSVSFYDKEIGFEDLTLNRTYQYQSNHTTFEGSNFDYMGFRKDNWYRFGIIAQYQTGEWSDVMFICDVQCDRSSRTEIQYKSLAAFEISNSINYTTRPFDNITKPSKVPIKSIYYIPSANLQFNENAIPVFQELRNRGFKRIKPVCVIPPVEYRNVITQGISCSTLYTGRNRRVLTNNGLFAMPSYFFRPLPLYLVDEKLIGNYSEIYKAEYPYTLRKVQDLTLPQNIQSDGDWLLNPTFTDERYAHYNQIYREYRHGFSLPPKDRINAELQSSDMSIHDYFYIVSYINSYFNDQISPLFDNTSGINLFEFATSPSYNNCYFKPYNSLYDENNESRVHFDDITNNSWIVDMRNLYRTLPYHDLYTTGYDNTVFIDETICTLNSPEIDNAYSTQIAPVFKNRDISVVGYAQVTGSAMDIDIPQTAYSTYISGQCLFNIDESRLDAPTKEYLSSLHSTIGICNQVMPFISGPWWIDTMYVDNFIHCKNETLSGAFRNIAWFSIMTGLITPEVGSTMSIFADMGANNLDQLMFDNSIIQQNPDITLQDSDLYNTASVTGIKLNPTKNCIWFCRDIDPRVLNPKFKAVTSFYGELDGKHIGANDKKDYHCVFQENTTYPHTVSDEGRMFVFSEFPRYSNYKLKYITNNELDSSFSNWASASLTWNTTNLTTNVKNDIYWDQFDNNRHYLNSSFTLPYEAGDVTIPNINNGNGFLGDALYTVAHDDFRGLFSYYFFPYYSTTKPSSFFDNLAYPTIYNATLSKTYLIKHPWLLPLDDRYNWNMDWYSSFNNMNNVSECDISTMHSDIIPYDNGSKFGCHYYAPFSTNFVGSYFEPYYPHIIYPFMNNDTNIPFCGSRRVYNKANTRPAYNSTHSHLYSCCTNYLSGNLIQNKTYSAFYHSPNLTQLSMSEPDLSNLPFISNSNSNITKLYSYNCSDSASNPNVPILAHRTETLTAAMKWYRGFKHLASNENLVVDKYTKLISPGCYLTKSSLMGNLMFSGWLPQFFTKSGLLQTNIETTHLNYIVAMSSKKSSDGSNYFEAINDFLAVHNQSINLEYNSSPHIVYCIQPNNETLQLLPKFKVTNPHLYLLADNGFEYHFKPQFYYKEFINEQPVFCGQTNDAALPMSVKLAANWMYSTYPHTGHFEEFEFDECKSADQPFWNKDLQLSAYPSKSGMIENQLTIDAQDDNLIRYDKYGYARSQDNYWLLPISNMYNNIMIDNYRRVNKNPYTYETISIEQWNWKMCGNTVNLNDLFSTNNPHITYLEGDTYFQRYNCLKTVSSDTTAQYLNEDSTENSNLGNDVTETASVMIESYVNLDGLYWQYDALLDTQSSPLLHPFYSHTEQINPVYNIQNDLCDVFKQIDQTYYASDETHYPTQIMWSAQKQDGENVDSWGIVPATNKMLVSGEMGSINKLISYRNSVYCLQDHGISVLNYSSQVIEPTTTNSTLTLYLNDATRLQDVTYLSRTIGTLNKWSVVLGQRGFYWIDETLQQLCRCGESESGFGIENMSIKYGFKSWSKSHILHDNCVWNANTFLSNTNAFKANYDLKNEDLYWANGDVCICFNETLDCFTSFYSYEKIPYKFNYLNKCYSIKNTENDATIWEDYSTYDHKLYSQRFDSYLDLLVNPSGQYDKVFNFIEYHTEACAVDNDFKYEMLNPYNKVSVLNMYQIGNHVITKNNTKQRFNLWRSDLPREIKNNHNTMNRIRSPWCHVKLEYDPTKTHVFYKDSISEYRDKLYYINVNYTIPEQPLKTNIRQ